MNYSSLTKKAKAIGNPFINSRATLGASIGEGNTHFFKYSLMEEVVRETNTIPIIDQNAVIEEELSRTALCRRIPIFQGEVLGD